jgi:hypothetical protein
VSRLSPVRAWAYASLADLAAAPRFVWPLVGRSPRRSAGWPPPLQPRPTAPSARPEARTTPPPDTRPQTPGRLSFPARTIVASCVLATRASALGVTQPGHHGPRTQRLLRPEPSGLVSRDPAGSVAKPPTPAGPCEPPPHGSGRRQMRPTTNRRRISSDCVASGLARGTGRPLRCSVQVFPVRLGGLPCSLSAIYQT